MGKISHGGSTWQAIIYLNLTTMGSGTYGDDDTMNLSQVGT
jgi:hypothetical protein